ncbi:hypothetical protein Q8F55_007233 [Vanrija albida]|uniref:Phenazine biosynthesis protein PhzF family n=1 Tax=Vanrija albida TaxID=181172 RepID=A0ABR3PZA8_9TREE
MTTHKHAMSPIATAPTPAPAQAAKPAPSDPPSLRFVTVFPSGAGGGNPCPIVTDAAGLSDADMKALSARYGHEASFILPPADPANLARIRYFVPAHEMEMCGHATLGSAWLLRRAGVWTTPAATVETLAGVVELRFDGATGRIDVGQPRGEVQPVAETSVPRIARLLSLGEGDILTLNGRGLLNASTSRFKTLIPLRSVETLHAIDTATLNADEVRETCDEIESTGLYPFAVGADGAIHARQFPRSSGYVEDAATGIAASAALYGALQYGIVSGAAGSDALTVHQGEALGRPSAIQVTLRRAGAPDEGCWISGSVEEIELQPVA